MRRRERDSRLTVIDGRPTDAVGDEPGTGPIADESP